MEAREKAEHGGVAVASSVAALFCCKYDLSNKADPVAKKSNETKFAPDPEGYLSGSYACHCRR